MKGEKQIPPGRGRALLKSHIQLRKMLDTASPERGMKRAIQRQHAQKGTEHGPDLHRAEGSKLKIHRRTPAATASTGWFHSATDSGIAEVLLNKKKKKEIKH